MCKAINEPHEWIHWKHCKSTLLNILYDYLFKNWIPFSYSQDDIIRAFSNKVKPHMMNLLRQYKDTVSCVKEFDFPCMILLYAA